MKSIADGQQSIRRLVRELSGELSGLNRQVSARVELREVDLGCLDLLAREGPMSPSALAKAAQLHPATLTGILDRLEQNGWVERRRDPQDRRGVLVHAMGNRARELVANYAGMNSAIDKICASYDLRDLTIIADFLERVSAAAREANAELSD